MVSQFHNLDGFQQQHLETLGFHTVAGYRVWCHKNGLGTYLNKTPDQCRAEQNLFARLEAQVPPPGPPHIWADPLPVIVEVLRKYKTYEEVRDNLPDIPLI